MGSKRSKMFAPAEPCAPHVAYLHWVRLAIISIAVYAMIAVFLATFCAENRAAVWAGLGWRGVKRHLDSIDPVELPIGELATFRDPIQ